MKRYSCIRCGNDKFYRIRREKKRCSRCLYEFTPKPVKHSRLSNKIWKQIIEWFLLERSGLWTAKRIGLSKNTVYEAFNRIRQVCLKDVPEIFSGTVEVDETYIGGQKKNKNKSQLRKEKEMFDKESKRGFGTTKQPAFGILTRCDKVFAQLINGKETKDLIPIITKKVKIGSRICSDTWRAYTGLAAKGYVHRTVEHTEKDYVRGKNHINGLEGFWGYLKRKLAAKGGVRRRYLHLYLGEHVWRYNNRNLTFEKQIKRLFKLLKVSG